MTIRNINSAWGETVEFDDVEDMERAILACGGDFPLPADGLKVGRDYEEITEVPAIEAFRLRLISEENKVAMVEDLDGIGTGRFRVVAEGLDEAISCRFVKGRLVPVVGAEKAYEMWCRDWACEDDWTEEVTS